jgi:hypothetical protein
MRATDAVPGDRSRPMALGFKQSSDARSIGVRELAFPRCVRDVEERRVGVARDAFAILFREPRDTRSPMGFTSARSRGMAAIMRSRCRQWRVSGSLTLTIVVAESHLMRRVPAR